VPKLERFLRTTLGRDDVDRWNAIDGVISKIENDLVEIALRKLKLAGKRRPRRENSEANAIELEFATISRARTAAAKCGLLIRKAKEVQQSHELSEGIKVNQIANLKDRTIIQIRKVPNEISVEVMGRQSEEVDGSCIDKLLGIPDDQFDRKLSWMSSTLEKQNDAVAAKRKKVAERMTQNLYREDPKRAMRWYVNDMPSPSCPLQVEGVAQTLSERWTAEDGYVAPEEESIWHATQRILYRDSSTMLKKLEDAEFLPTIIEARPKQSANGPDGVGYAMLQMGSEHSSKALALISKAMLKHQRCPTKWLASRSILLFKHGDPNNMESWRPLTISSCVYRTWACAVASTLQEINATRPIFSDTQKWFIRGIEGCLEHTTAISEKLAEAN
jgi:hypothetical protein